MAINMNLGFKIGAAIMAAGTVACIIKEPLVLVFLILILVVGGYLGKKSHSRYFPPDS